VRVWVVSSIRAARTARVTERAVDRRAVERRSSAQRELAYQRRVLRRIALGAPLTRTLDGLCRHVERQYPPAHCTVLLLDRAAGVLRHGACPSLPRSYSDAIDGLPVADGAAACGTAAARGEVVIVEDVLTDPLTAGFAEIAQRFGLASVWSHPLRRADGEVLGTFAVYRGELHRPSRSEIRAVTNVGDLAALAIERSRMHSAREAVTNHDSLTGLPNRASFLEMVNEQLRVSGRRLGLVFVDIDRFPQINDTVGRQAGERILQELAERLRTVVGDAGLVSRLGDDEFSVMTTGTGLRRVEQLAERITGAIEIPIVLDGVEFFLTASVGIAFADRTMDAYGVVRAADAAMHAARGLGPGRRQVYDDRLRARLRKRLRDETELRHATERGQLEMHYQPILQLVEHRWSGVEALVRWRHPARGLLSPDEFIPLAEETGLIVALGARIIELATEQARIWWDRMPGIQVAVNASALELAHPSFAAGLIAGLERVGLPPRAMAVEVTESALMRELDAAVATLERLSAFGVEVMIDDFGIGHSSLARLGELPISGLKVDRRFTAGLGRDPRARAVLAAIVGLARAYELPIVAEGIENAGALAIVEELGCEYAQGFHLGRPVAASVLEPTLHAAPAAVVSI
jgi:diguanylate cyclase (GGDEF)-like protein